MFLGSGYGGDIFNIQAEKKTSMLLFVRTWEEFW
jgi:hypothetical protein